MDTGVFFFAFLPPHNDRPSNVFRTFFDVGIYTRWIMEFHAVTHSTRVQERIRVVHKTKISVEHGNIIPAMSLNSKIGVVFSLFGLCLLGCCFIFSFEIVFHYCSCGL